MRQSFQDRFWSKVLIVPYDKGCWLWTGYLNKKGYGALTLGSRGAGSMKAHAASWFLTHGEIPKGLCVLHRCDNPACVNPSHLWLGTRGDNNRDSIKKRRNAFGSRNGQHKLTTEEVLAIRKIGRTKTLSEIGRIYGIAFSTVSRILNLKRWTYLDCAH